MQGDCEIPIGDHAQVWFSGWNFYEVVIKMAWQINQRSTTMVILITNLYVLNLYLLCGTRGNRNDIQVIKCRCIGVVLTCVEAIFATYVIAFGDNPNKDM